ncbi:YdcH family protein [Algoriphagus sp.]|uniref:YdcH family protein n=1 Tax=Algoriphagus sp. TaxID=1872435 RepID=UPI00391CE7C0
MFRKHPLTEEFPEFAEKIHSLKVENVHFKKLFDEYDEVDHEIYKIESDAEPASDETANQMRINRLRLKDEIYHMLKDS